MAIILLANNYSMQHYNYVVAYCVAIFCKMATHAQYQSRFIARLYILDCANINSQRGNYVGRLAAAEGTEGRWNQRSTSFSTARVLAKVC